MSESTQDRLSVIRKKVEALSWYSTFHFPIPVTEEDATKQEDALHAVQQARLAWELATRVIGVSTSCDISVPNALNSELAWAVYCSLCLHERVLEDPEVTELVDLAEQGMDQALKVLSELKPH